ncbi:MAG: anthranilate synthase component I [Kiritimatiellae bacterium]|nr:anthranilate synthase component I [Kiritimatiellia bacterium]
MSDIGPTLSGGLRLHPGPREFRERAARGTLVPVWVELLADEETPLSAYARVRRVLRQRDHASHTFLLESVEGGERVGRYSFIGGAPRAIVRAWGRRVRVQHPDGSSLELPEGDPLDALQGLMARYRPVGDPSLPPFVGGAVGFLGYDLIRVFEPRVPVREDQALRAPDMVFMITDALLVFDRARHSLRILANADTTEGADRAYDQAAATIESLAAALREPGEKRLTDVTAATTVPEPRSTMSRDEFEESVRRAQDHIRAGDIIQVVLSQRFETAFAGDSLDVYRALRWINPSPYMFLLDLGESAMIGSSPEVHVRCIGGNATIRPIAGTRPRAASPEEDARLERELLADPKERAEHIMLVDLARNDLGRVCEPGSVRVPELMTVERYSHVMHIVSDVTGRLAADHNVYDLMRATFPAGTVTGAPKIRAMEIIADLERSRRGPYAGAVGYFGFDGNLDSCITIRTIILDEGRAYVQAGAGIVADSDPVREYEETRNKARAMLHALALAQRFAAGESLP